MKKILLICAAMVAMFAMIGCNGTSSENMADTTQQLEVTLIGQWEAVDGYEQWGCECVRLDSSEYHYISFFIDEDSIKMVMHDKFEPSGFYPPYDVFTLTFAYFVDSGNVVTGHDQVSTDFTLFKIRELSADTLFLKADCSFGDGMGREYYTMKRK